MQLPASDYDYEYSTQKQLCQWLDKSDEMQFMEVLSTQVLKGRLILHVLSCLLARCDLLSDENGATGWRGDGGKRGLFDRSQCERVATRGAFHRK